MIIHRIVSHLFFGLTFTVLIEACGAFMLGVRTRRGQAVVLLANLITNPILQCILIVVAFYLSPTFHYFFLIPLEIAVVILEGWIYKSALHLKRNPFLVSLILNAASYCIGAVLAKIVF